MKNILTAIFLLLSLNSVAQSITDSSVYRSIEEVKSFIKKVNDDHKQYNSTHNEFIEYVLYVYKSDDQKGICYTLGYIMNSDDYRYILPKYFFKVDNEIVLVRLSKNIAIDSLKGIKLEKLDRYNQIKIVQKLYPSSLGGFTYQPPGMTFCISEGNVERKYYQNADEIPLEKSIYATFPTGGKIEQLREPQK
jgi:hypothetical protein